MLEIYYDKLLSFLKYLILLDFKNYVYVFIKTSVCMLISVRETRRI